MASTHRSPALAGAFICVLFVAAPGLAQAPTSGPVPSAVPEPSCIAPQPAIAAPVGEPDQPYVTVFAAASLTDAFEALQEPWSASHPGSELVLSFDSSSTLRAQIEEGAPVDVFASADTANAQALVDACLAPGPVTPFARNSLTIVVPAGNPAGIAAAADLARPGLRYVAAGPDVPISRYATQAIARLAALAGYPADFVAAVTSNTISEEDNVRAVLAKIELGEGDAAIVYVTDATSSDDVEAIALPTEADVPATYTAVAVADAPEPAMGAAFLEFLAGAEAQGVLAGFGFTAIR
jgi:molybdate transport system substrate-binding protein